MKFYILIKLKIKKMKKILSFLVVFVILFSACEGPLNHKFIIENKTNSKIKVDYKLKGLEKDTLKIEVLKDSSKVFYIDSEMQGFFSGKIPARDINLVFDEITITKNDTSFYNINLTDTTMWKVEYYQGVYKYVCTIKK